MTDDIVQLKRKEIKQNQNIKKFKNLFEFSSHSDLFSFQFQFTNLRI